MYFFSALVLFSFHGKYLLPYTYIEIYAVFFPDECMYLAFLIPAKVKLINEQQQQQGSTITHIYIPVPMGFMRIIK